MRQAATTTLLQTLSAPTQSLSVGLPAHSSGASSSSSSLIVANMLQADNFPGVGVDVGVDADADVDVGAASGVNVASAAANQSLAFHLLHNEKIYMNLTQVLNISAENLTTLLISVQNTTNILTSLAASPASSASAEQQLTVAYDTPMSLLATLTTCYALIFIAGVLGNLITCIVISRNNFMHTATNFYLFNLAVSDLILLLSGMPQELYNLWYPDSYPFTDAICIMGSVLAETAANATVLTITAFTVERYIAICHPFRQHTMSKLSRAIKFIFAIWLMALLLALPQAMQFSVLPQEGGYLCTMEDDFSAHVFAVSGFIFFGGPMTAICVLYVLIGVKLKRSRLLQSLPRRSYDINRSLNAQSRVIRMLVAVAVAFFLCWAPFHAQRLMAVYGLSLINIGIDRENFNDYFRILDYTSGVLYFLSTCINPLLYNIMSHKFREAFKITLTRHFGLSSKHQSQNHNYSALLRQNGSMRLHTTVNHNALEHFGSSYRVVQFRCRDPGHQLSLQDSIRTTTTTTTTVSSVGGGNTGTSLMGGTSSSSSSRRSSSSTQRNHRCISIGAHLSKNAGNVGNAGTKAAATAHGTPNAAAGILSHRMLQTQSSQLSSVGDANALHEANAVATAVAYPAGTSYRKRALLTATSTQNCASNGGGMLITPGKAIAVDVLSPEWPLHGDSTNKSKPTHMLRVSQPTRARLKLSRIITRREQDPYAGRKPSTQVERLQQPKLPQHAPCDELPLQTPPLRPQRKLEGLAAKMHLRHHKSQKSRRKCAKEQQTKARNATPMAMTTTTTTAQAAMAAAATVDATVLCSTQIYGNPQSL